jgi:hypothetical protein
MPRPAERLHLPVFHSAYSRHRYCFGLRPARQHDLRVRHAPTHSGRSKHHNWIRNLKRDAVARGTRPAPPRRPALSLQPIDQQTVRIDRQTSAGALQDSAVTGDGERGCDIANGTLSRDPVQEPDRPRYPEAHKQTRDADHNQQLEYGKPYSKALTHPPFIRSLLHGPAPENRGEKPENAPFAV